MAFTRSLWCCEIAGKSAERTERNNERTCQNKGLGRASVAINIAFLD